MTTVSKKLEKIIQAKTDIAAAITEKGVTITEADTFLEYADKIREITSSDGTNYPAIRVIVW